MSEILPRDPNLKPMFFHATLKSSDNDHGARRRVYKPLLTPRFAQWRVGIPILALHVSHPRQIVLVSFDDPCTVDLLK